MPLASCSSKDESPPAETNTPEARPTEATPTETTEAPPSDAPDAPPGATPIGGITIGQNGEPGGPVPNDAVQVDVVTDYICPWCKHIEDLLGEQLRTMSAAGEIIWVVHPLGYLDTFSEDEYSTRAANAAVTVAAFAPAKFLDFDALLWENQPAEGGPGLSDAKLAELAKQAGVPADVVAKLPEQPFAEWVIQSTATVTTAEGFKGTPWVLLSYQGGKMYPFANWTTDPLEQAVAKVKAGQAP